MTPAIASLKTAVFTIIFRYRNESWSDNIVINVK